MNQEQKIVAAGFIYSDNLALLARRSLTKALAPNQLHLPGGHVEFGEDPISALEREIKEEFRVQIRIEVPLYTFSYLNSNIHTVGLVFAASLVGPRSAVQFDATDHSEIVWASRRNLDELFDNKSNYNYLAAVTGFRYLEKAV